MAGRRDQVETGSRGTLVLFVATLAVASMGLLAGDVAAATGASGEGDSVLGRFTWSQLPGQADMPGLPDNPGAQPTTHSMSYAFETTGEGNETFDLSADLGSGLALTCGTEAPQPPGSWTPARVTLGGFTVSAGHCLFEHPVEDGPLPQRASLAYQGNLTRDSCERGQTPEFLQDATFGLLPEEHPGLSPTCEAGAAGNLQAYRGAGVFYVDHVSNETAEVEHERASAQPWSNPWDWEQLAVDLAGDGDASIFSEASTFTFTEAQRTTQPRLDYRWSLDTHVSNLEIHCFRDAAVDENGTAFLSPSAAGGVLRVGECTLDSGSTYATASATFPAGTDLCEGFLGGEICDQAPFFTDTVRGSGLYTGATT